MPDERPWFELAPDEIVALPLDELALRILRQMGAGSAGASDLVGRLGAADEVPRAAKQAVVEAWWWLVRKGLIAPDAQNVHNDEHGRDTRWWLATRVGVEVAARPNGAARLRAGERIDVDLHPAIAEDVRSEFLRGKFAGAVWAAMRQVEISVREASGADPSSYGEGLLGFAFGKGGTLIDSETAAAEQQGIAFLFRGAYKALKNPHSHHDIEFDDPTEAAEIVLLASFLLRVLDRLRSE